MERDILAYTYMANYHCKACALAAWGRGTDGYVGTDSTDGEGNPIGVVFTWDEWQQSSGENETLGCGTCGCEIDYYAGEGL